MLLSSLCYGAAISLFFSALCSYITYTLVSSRYEDNSCVCKEIEETAKSVVRDAFTKNKIIDKLEFLEKQRKDMLTDLNDYFNKNKSSVIMINNKLDQCVYDVEKLKETCEETYRATLEKIKSFENKLMTAKVIFD